jgi:hypothetical protein
MLAVALLLLGAGHSSTPLPAPELYSYAVTRDFMTMPDGVLTAPGSRASAPSRRSGEAFPSCWNCSPTAKTIRSTPETSAVFLLREPRLHHGEGGHPGTGGSEGRPPSKYSDCGAGGRVGDHHGQIARSPRSNWERWDVGILTGGFNALQVAMLHPPELKAIVAPRLTISTTTTFTTSTARSTGLVRAADRSRERAARLRTTSSIPPTFATGSRRRAPIFTFYLRHTGRVSWWRHALRWNYSAIQVLTYFIGGLLDGYRDTPIRASTNSRRRSKSRSARGTTPYSTMVTPGPNYEWRARVVEWWNHWLRGKPTSLLDEPGCWCMRDSVTDPQLP